MNDDSHSNAEIVPEGNRQCPICNETMSIETEYGIQIDVCVQHGVWLDKVELGKIKGEVLDTKSSSEQYLAEEARRDDKLRGIFFGWLSLSMD